MKEWNANTIRMMKPRKLSSARLTLDMAIFRFENANVALIGRTNSAVGCSEQAIHDNRAISGDEFRLHESRLVVVPDVLRIPAIDRVAMRLDDFIIDRQFLLATVADGDRHDLPILSVQHDRSS